MFLSEKYCIFLDEVNHLVWFEGSPTWLKIADSEGDVSNILSGLFVARDNINTNLESGDPWLKKFKWAGYQYSNIKTVGKIRELLNHKLHKY